MVGCRNSPSLSTRKKKLCPFNFSEIWDFVPWKNNRHEKHVCTCYTQSYYWLPQEKNLSANQGGVRRGGETLLGHIPFQIQWNLCFGTPPLRGHLLLGDTNFCPSKINAHINLCILTITSIKGTPLNGGHFSLPRGSSLYGGFSVAINRSWTGYSHPSSQSAPKVITANNKLLNSGVMRFWSMISL